MNKNITLTQATYADIDLIRALGIETFEETFAPYNTRSDMDQYLGEAFSYEKIKSEIEEPDTQYWIAHCDGEPAAYSRWCFGKQEAGMDARAPMEFHRLYVLARFKGKGIGHTILTAAIKAARDRNCDRIWLGVWEHNAPAISFYQKFGFERFGEHAFMLGQDLQTDWVMKKELI